MFSLNYRHDFIEQIWGEETSMAKHLRSKFNSYYKQYGSRAVMVTFYSELDNENREKLENYIINVYKG